MENIKLSAPWMTFVSEVKALFKEDSDVNVKHDENENILKVYVADHRKAEALAKLLPAEKIFGNVTLKIEVIPPNAEKTAVDLFQEAFFGNPAVQYVYSYETPLGKFSYIVFKNKVVQFFNDQMDDINGNKSTLFQDIAKDVFGTEQGVFYCTEAGDKTLQKPLGEWP